MRHRITLLVVFLIAGAALNIAVAWTCAVFVNPLFAQPRVKILSRSNSEHNVVTVLRRFGHTRVERGRLWGTLRDTNSSKIEAIQWGGPMEMRTDPVTGEVASLFLRDGRKVYSECLAGWPLRSLSGTNDREVLLRPAGNMWVRIGTPGGSGISNALPLSQFPGVPFGSTWRALPYQPIWPGFILNTLFYALLVWLLVTAPGKALRMIRRRRGQCERCAYPVGVSPVCTECGHELPAPKSVALHA